MCVGERTITSLALPYCILKLAKTSGAALEDEKSSDDEDKRPDSDKQQAKGDSGKPQDVAIGTHMEDTTKQSPSGGKGKGGDRKQDGDGGGTRQRKGLLGAGKVGITLFPS